MSVKRMVYLFKQKLNKVDSEQNTNFRLPEIDQFLREAEFDFVNERIIKATKIQGSLDFTNKISEELRIVNVTTTLTPIQESGNNWYVILPDNYMYYLKCDVTATKNNTTLILKGQYRSSVEEINYFLNSSFEWQEINVTLKNGKLEFTTDGCILTSVKLHYIRKPILFHNAEDASSKVMIEGSNIKNYYDTYSRIPKGLITHIDTVEDLTLYELRGYQDLNSNKLFGYVDSEIPESAHNEIVNKAVDNAIRSIGLNNNNNN